MGNGMSVHLLNGTDRPRERSSEGCTVHDCGCAHTDLAWLQMCGEHHSEWETRHVAASIDHNFGG